MDVKAIQNIVGSVASILVGPGLQILLMYCIDIRCIRVIEFWGLKPDFRHILCPNARKCA